MTRPLLALAPFAALTAFYALVTCSPYQWRHSLTDACTWRQRPSLALWGPSQPDAEANAAQLACWERRGLKSETPFVKLIVRKWPQTEEADR